MSSSFELASISTADYANALVKKAIHDCDIGLISRQPNSYSSPKDPGTRFTLNGSY